MSGIAEKADWALDNKTPQRAAVEAEDADVTWTPEDERAFIAELPTAVQEPVDEIVATGDTEALENALQAILGIVPMALLVSVFLSPGSGAAKPEAAFDLGGG